MWPWEHVATGYLLYSLGCRALGRESPDDGETVALAVAALMPDLVDKPLSWGLGWFPTGYAVAHSALVAIPLGVGALALGRQYDCRRLGIAFVVGYWSHLLGDILNPLRHGGRPSVGPVLWPFSDTTPYEVDYGIERGFVYFQEFGEAIVAMDPFEVLLLYVSLPAIAVMIWVLDGTPGLRIPLRVTKAVRERLGLQ